MLTSPNVRFPFFNILDHSISYYATKLLTWSAVHGQTRDFMVLLNQVDQADDAISEGPGAAEDRYLPIVGLIYQASENAELWPQLLSLLAESQYDLHQLPAEAREYITHFLAKHFSRALNISKNLTQLKQQDQLLDDILAHAPVGLCYLNTDGTLLYVNKAANLMLSRQPFQVVDSKLFIKDECFASAGKKHSALSIIQDESQRISIYQFAVEDPVKGPVCALLMIDNNQNGGLIQQRAKTLYDLTATEQKVLGQLIAGNRVENIAVLLRRSLNTIKHHIKSIYFKTGVQKRSQLIKKLSTSSRLGNGRALSDFTPNSPAPNTHYFYRDDYRLAYSSFGPEQGTPLVFMHCYLGNALELPADMTCLEEYNVRLLIPERPGFGYSYPDPQHNYESWSQLMLAWLEYLNIERFQLLGYSSGVPFALQLAQDLGSRIESLSLAAAFPHVKAIERLADSGSGTRTLLKVFSSSPALIKPLLSAMLLNPAEYFHNNVLINGRPPFCAPDKDKQWLSLPENAQSYIAQLKRCKRQGAKGVVREFQLISKPWYFDFEKIRCPAQIWHGAEDNISTMATYEYLRECLPDAECHVIEDETHYLYYRCFPDILKALVQERRATLPPG